MEHNCQSPPYNNITFKPIVASVLNATGKPFDKASVVAYINSRFDKSVNATPVFEM